MKSEDSAQASSGNGDRLSMGGNPMGGNEEKSGPSGEPTMQKLKYSLRRETTSTFKPITAAKFTTLMGELKGAG